MLGRFAKFLPEKSENCLIKKKKLIIRPQGKATECEPGPSPEPIEYYLISTVLFLMVHELHLYYLHRSVFVRLTNPLPKLKIDTTCSSLRSRLPRLLSTIKFYEWLNCYFYCRKWTWITISWEWDEHRQKLNEALSSTLLSTWWKKILKRRKSFEKWEKGSEWEGKFGSMIKGVINSAIRVLEFKFRKLSIFPTKSLINKLRAEL